MRNHLWFRCTLGLSIATACSVALWVALALALPTEAQGPQAGARVIPIIGPVSMDKDLRSLPKTPPKHPFYVQPPLRRYPVSGGQASSTPTVLPQISRAPRANMPSSILNFDGMNETNSFYLSTPADPNGDVGKNHYLQAVNDAFEVFDKSTGVSLAGPTSFDALFSALGTSTPCGNNQNNRDPVLFYDQLADRWVISDFAFPSTSGPFYQCIAVSKTGDPIGGGYWLYTFQHDSSNPSWFGDYPKFGLWPDAYYMSANMLSSGSFQAVEVYALNRATMISGTGGTTPTIVAFTVTSSTLGSASSLLPARFRFGAPPNGIPEYFAAIDSPSDIATVLNTVHIWKFHVDFGAPANSTFGIGVTHAPNANVTVANFTDSGSVIIPQSGTSQLLKSHGDRLMANLWYQNLGGAESLWAVHTVNNSGPTAIRWYQINVTGGTIATTPLQQQSFDNNADGVYRWTPSLSLDDSGNMSVGYNASNSLIFPAIRYNGRLRSDPTNTLAQGETTLIDGGGNQTNPYGNWGDYSAMTIDPIDGCTFWYTNEYYSTSSDSTWNTRIGAFRFPAPTGCNSPTAVTLSSFAAFAQDTYSSPYVMLQWTTGSEVNTAGFNIYRSEREGGPYTRINMQLNPASGDPLVGARYEYQDHGVALGTYYYQLEDVELNGTSSRHQPVSVSLTNAAKLPFETGTLFLLGIGGLVLLSVGACKISLSKDLRLHFRAWFRKLKQF